MRRLAFALALGLAASTAPSVAAEKLEVVASFSILADMTRTVGGDRVAVTALVGPDGDAHVFSPTPRNAAMVAQADAIVVNGLGFEGWLDRLIKASGFEGTIITATADVTPLPAHRGDGDHEEDHGDDHGAAHDDDDEDEDADGHGHHHGVADPHAWQDPGNAVLYVEAIAAGLSAADPDGAAVYEANAAAYRSQIEALDAEARALFDAVPADRRTVLTTHDAFAYLGRAYGLTFVAAQGVSTEAEASARDVAGLVRQIREAGVDAVFVENNTDNRMVERIADETGVPVGGRLYAGALSQADGSGSTYIAMMRHNIDALSRALGAAAGAVR